MAEYQGKSDSVNAPSSGGGAEGTPAWRYAAFVSYAHTDSKAAERVHKRLEGYRPKSTLSARRNRLRPIFRDREELTAHHSLPMKIREAAQGSRRLIVLCSPAAKTSKWVTEEIRLFRSLHGDGAILCALLEGTPETSFPEALTEGGREPLAANLSGGRDSFRYGMQQIIASLLDVGLDDIVQRDSRRRRQFGALVTLGALVFSAVMGGAAYSALQAKKQAEANRGDAEDLVEYMITELKSALQPVGRLDILDGVGDKVMSYYGSHITEDMPDDRIMRYARALHLLAQVDLQAGRFDEAHANVQSAYDLTQDVLARNPDDPPSIFVHAQSAFWVGGFLRKTDSVQAFRPFWEEYYRLTARLYEVDNTDFDWIMEAAYGENNMGIVERSSKNYELAGSHYDKAISFLDAALDIKPSSASAISERTNALVGAEQVSLAQGRYKDALAYSRRIISSRQERLKKDPRDFQLKRRLAVSRSNLLWQYYLMLPYKEQRAEFSGPLEMLESLHKHDPKNLEWTLDYYWHLILVAQLTRDNAEKLKAISQVEFIFDGNPSSPSVKRLDFYRQYIQIQKHQILGNNAAALKIARSLRPRFDPDVSSRSERQNDFRAATQMMLALRLFELGDTASARDLAQRYLADRAGKTSPPLEVRYYIAQAHRILGKCTEARAALRPVLDNGSGVKAHFKSILQCGP